MALKMNTMENAGTINLGKTTAAVKTSESEKSVLYSAIETIGEGMLGNPYWE